MSTNTTLPVTTPSISSIISSVLSPVIPPTTTTPRTTSVAPPVVVTSIITASAPQGTVAIITSIITRVDPASTPPAETVVITTGPSTTSNAATTSTSSATTTSNTALSSGGNTTSNNKDGLSSAATVAIAVVIPILVIALLVVAGLFFWRRRKQRQSEKEQRKEEMEQYGYNPNDDPTLPTVAATDEIADDSNGYRGWGAAGIAARKTSTLGGATQVSDGGGYNPSSPGQLSEHPSELPLTQQRGEPLGKGETVAELGAAGAAVGGAKAAAGIKRGPSNASSSYSAGDHSNTSIEPPLPPLGPQDYYTDNGYYQPGPYDGQPGAQQPIIRDNPARRNTRIQEANVPMHQGSSGIAQNF